MFSKRFYKLMSLASLFVRFFGVAPLLFDEKLLLFKIDPTESVHKTMEVNYNLFIFWTTAAFCSVIKFKKERDVDRFNLTFAYWLNGFIVAISYSFLRWFYHDCCLIVNGLLLVMRYIHKTYMPTFDPDTSKFNMVIDFLLCLCAFCMVCSYNIIIILLLYDPTGLVFLGALIPSEYFQLPVRLFVIIFHTYLLIVGHISVCIVPGAVIMYASYITPFYLKELRMGRATYKTRNKLRKSENIRHMYRSLQVLHAHTMQLCGIFIVFVHGHLMLTCLFCNAVLIRYWNALMPMSKVQFLSMGVMLTGFWTFVLEMGRYFFEKGGKVLGSWKGGRWDSEYENKLMKKFHRSCKPILLCYGSQFVIRRATVLVFLRGVIRGTFRTLLLFTERK